MANAVCLSFLDILWAPIIAHTIKAAILGPSYAYSVAHTDFSDLTDVLATAILSGVGSVDGVLDADDLVVSGVSSELMSSVWVYDDTLGKLIRFFDQGVGFSILPSGNVSLVWSNDANSKILALGRR